MTSYTYEYHAEYGGPELDPRELTVRVAGVAADGLSIELAVDGLRAGYIHELGGPGLRSAGGAALVHPVAYYTLNRIPAAH